MIKLLSRTRGRVQKKLGAMDTMFVTLILVLICIGRNGIKGSDDDEGFLEGTYCKDDRDCYINGGTHLRLACWSNVNKCKCMSTIRSIYHLSWDKTSKKCLSSKYGHCGSNGPVQVGCSDGFACIENRCRDPKDKKKTVKGVFKFPVSTCHDCNFSEDLHLVCDWESTKPNCLCEQIFSPDKKSNAWDIRNYDGNNDCSVSQFGPCGTRNGVTIRCHGSGMTCVNGLCTNAKRPLNSINEVCQETKNCVQGLICSYDYTCIKPKSSGEGVACNSDIECIEGLVCKHPGTPWSISKCTNPAGPSHSPEL